MNYFIITSGESGTRIDGPMSDKEVLTRITPDNEGTTYYGRNIHFLVRIPHSDKGYWIAEDNSMIIIRGDITVPKVVTTAVKYEL